jgi:hypothetical protein
MWRGSSPFLPVLADQASVHGPDPSVLDTDPPVHVPHVSVSAYTVPVRVTDDSACNPCSRIMCNLCPRSIPPMSSVYTYVPVRGPYMPFPGSYVPFLRSFVPFPRSYVPFPSFLHAVLRSQRAFPSSLRAVPPFLRSVPPFLRSVPLFLHAVLPFLRAFPPGVSSLLCKYLTRVPGLQRLLQAGSQQQANSSQRLSISLRCSGAP